MGEYVIEKGIPIPETARASGWKGPLRRSLEALEVGDSIVAAMKRAGVYAATAVVTKEKGFTFTARPVENGFRIWRTK